MQQSKLAHHVFLGNNGKGAAVPGSKVNSKTASGGFNAPVSQQGNAAQFGGNALTFSGYNHPQFTTAKDKQKAKVDFQKMPASGANAGPSNYTAHGQPTQHRIGGKVGATGISGQVGGKVPFNNIPNRPLAGSVQATGAAHKVPRGYANALSTQRTSRATARAVTGLNTTTMRGGSSQSGRLKPVAGTTDTYNVAGTGGHSSQVYQSQTLHIGFHRIVVSKTPGATPNRLKGKLSNANSGKTVAGGQQGRPQGSIFQPGAGS